MNAGEVADGVTDEVADELFALPPPQFTAARNAAADRVRAAGDASAAARIRSLRRPTLGAWLANLLAREQPDEIRALLDVGAGLRAAQDALDGAELRELTAQRRSVVSALSRQAKQAATRAGLPVGEGPLRDLEEHLQLVLADAELAEALSAGRLSSTRGPGARTPAAPAALAGEAGAAAPSRPAAGRTPAAGARRAGSRDGGRSGGRGADDGAEAVRAERGRAEASRRTAEAERAARQAEAAAAGARRELERTVAQRQRLRGRIEDQARRLDQARDQERELAAAERAARTRVEATDRASRRAQGQARDAAAHLRHLDDRAA